jgi:hypothetical protein
MRLDGLELPGHVVEVQTPGDDSQQQHTQHQADDFQDSFHFFPTIF